MDEVFEIKRGLEKCASGDGKKALELLRSLESIPMSIDILQTTHIGLTVNKIRKEITNTEVCSLSKSMVKKWKKLVNSSNSGSNNQNSSAGTKDNKDASALSSSNNINNNSSSSGNESRSNNNGNSVSQTQAITAPSNIQGVQSSNNSGSSAATTANVSHSSTAIDSTNAPSKYPMVTNVSRGQKESNSVESHQSVNQQQQPQQQQQQTRDSRPPPSQTEVPATADSVRLKCRELLANSLRKPLPEDLFSQHFHDEEILAARIEECIFQEFKTTDSKYKNRLRSRVSNLADARNPLLRYQVLCGDILPDRMAKMTADEMASDKLKKERERYTQESINDHQMSLTTGTRTSEIKCPACKKCDVTYNQMQTRSADEPMTTFCHCNECGKRWKFC